MALQHGIQYHETWCINAAAAAYKCDRLFMLDPPSRFLDSDVTGNQAKAMTRILMDGCWDDCPIITCEEDKRVKNLQLYPLKEVISKTVCHYFNNTVAYAVAYAYVGNAKQISFFGCDYTYRGNINFAEAGRACVEFWIAKCLEKGIKVDISADCSLMDSDVPAEEKLYGYHRLDDPLVILSDGERFEVAKRSSLPTEKPVVQSYLRGRHDDAPQPPEPKEY